MRAQLRTYHAIPSLQAHQDAHAYKQLQDAPRLKSILKGGAEDREEPNSIEKIKGMSSVPRTNPVNLIFLICQAAQKVADLHFPDGKEFHSLVMRTEFSSKSRANAFLWIVWFFLESDFTEEGCEENPFGPGVDYGLGVANQGIPRLVEMTADEAARENVDTEAEKEFGEEKRKTRAKILEMDQAYLTERDTKRGKGRGGGNDDGPAVLPRIRPSKHESDMDSTRSTPPPRGMGRGSRGGRGAALKYQIFEGSSPARHGSEGVTSRKPRPPTAHQLAVERNRSQRVEYILDKGLRRQHHKSRKLRRKEGAIYLAYKRLQAQVDPFEDSDNEDSRPRNLPKSDDKPTVFREAGLGGLCSLRAEPDDFGEEVSYYAAALRRSNRRLARWEGQEGGVVAPVKKRKENGAATNGTNGVANGDVTMDDVDMEGDNTMMAEDEATMMAEEDDVDPDRTEAMVDSDMD